MRHTQTSIKSALWVLLTLILLVILDRTLTSYDKSRKKDSRLDYTTGEYALLERDSVALSIGSKDTLLVNYYEGDVIWSSDDGSVVSVDSEGVITAESAGQTCIFAQCKDYMLTCVANVTE